VPALAGTAFLLWAKDADCLKASATPLQTRLPG
jgi:hypothetical protein